jgi:hypothetical protein
MWLSLLIGLAVGSADSLGFFLSFRRLAANPSATLTSRMLAILWELLRLFLLAGAFVLLIRWLDCPVKPALAVAVAASLAGKMLFVLLRLKAAA